MTCASVVLSEREGRSRCALAAGRIQNSRAWPGRQVALAVGVFVGLAHHARACVGHDAANQERRHVELLPDREAFAHDDGDLGVEVGDGHRTRLPREPREDLERSCGSLRTREATGRDADRRLERPREMRLVGEPAPRRHDRRAAHLPPAADATAPHAGRSGRRAVASPPARESAGRARSGSAARHPRARRARLAGPSTPTDTPAPAGRRNARAERGARGPPRAGAAAARPARRARGRRRSARAARRPARGARATARRAASGRETPPTEPLAAPGRPSPHTRRQVPARCREPCRQCHRWHTPAPREDSYRQGRNFRWQDSQVARWSFS